MRTGLLTILGAAALAATFPEVVKVDGGELRGAVQEGIGSFRGIPYAAPPVGGLRWRAPQRPPAWEGVREALRYGSSCLQGRSPDAARGAQSEDCLFLNVWTWKGKQHVVIATGGQLEPARLTAYRLR